MVAPAPILATKLYIPPPRAKIVLRPCLIERLNEGLTSGRTPGVTLISAPAGFGKTTLVSEWVGKLRFTNEDSRHLHLTPMHVLDASQDNRLANPKSKIENRVAWLSLDEGDNDPTRFLTYLVAALQTIDANIGTGVLGMLQASQSQLPPTETILTTLLNEIAAIPDNPSTGPLGQSGQRFILVLDDYHVIDSKAVDNGLTFLVEHLPPQMHLVIATREDPHLPLSRLRVRGQLTELRAADLRFTPSEAAGFLNQIMGLNLSAEEIAALETRTEGWIAGLQLAALSMQGHKDTTSFIKSFTGSHHFVLDYLVEEVLKQQSESIQSFLLRTSILDRMCGSLCDALLLDASQSASGQESLEYLERANLFIVPLDNERRWYRYHHLFGDLLRQRLGQPQELPEYHLRASAWYEANDDLAEAFHHAFIAGDFERAARLAEVAWHDMERSFQTVAWLGWVKKLPDTAICSRPWLCVQIGWAFSDVGELEPSESYLQNAERALAGMKDQEEFKSIPGNIALIRAGNAQIEGNLDETVRYAELSIQLAPENDNLIRAQAAITLGFTQWAVGNVEDSLQAMHTWMEDMQKLGNQMYVIASAFVLADMQVTLGRLGESEKALRQAIQRAAAFGQEAEVVTAHHLLGLAMLAHERGDEIARTQRLQTIADLGQRTTLIDWPFRWNLAQARLKESAGEWDAALNLLDEAQRGYIKNPIPILQPVDAHKARVYLKQRRLDKAQAWVRKRGLSVTDQANYLGEYEYLTLARARLVEQSFEGVSNLLDRLLELAETQKRMGSVIEILLTQALVYQAQSDRSRALAALKRVLTLAEPEGYLRIFVDEGEPMRVLISDFRHLHSLAPSAHPVQYDRAGQVAGVQQGQVLQIEKQSPGPDHKLIDYVDRLLAAFTRSESKVQNQKSEIFVEPLSQRELEVLRLIAQGLSNREIGEHLFLALSTVKGHTRIIFDKLQVQRRTEAVARARELGLL